MYARNFGTSTGQKWLPAVIIEVTGPVSFMVRLQDNRLVRCHLDHLRPVESETTTQTDESQENESEVELSDILIRASLTQSNSTETPETSETSPGADPDSTSTATAGGNIQSPESIESAGTPSAGEHGADTDTRPEITNGNTQSPAERPGTRKTYPKRNRHPPNWYRDHTLFILCIHATKLQDSP